MKNRIGMYSGIIYGIIAYIAWGVLPLYWKQLDAVSAFEILAHRVIWSFVFVMAFILFTSKMSILKVELHQLLHNWRLLAVILTTSLLISINWFIFIWAVNTNHIIEASLGYYINPLVNVLLGIFVLKERLLFWQLVSIVLAGIGVLILTIQYGSFPWISFTLAFSFAIYGLTKKLTKLDSLIGLAIETMIVTPIALAYILYLFIEGNESFLVANIEIKLLLIGGGIATALPLLWFAQATKRIPLSMVGMLQYIAPTLSLLFGVLLYHERFTVIHAFAFSFIWTGLVIFTFSKTKALTALEMKMLKKRSIGA